MIQRLQQRAVRLILLGFFVVGLFLAFKMIWFVPTGWEVLYLAACCAVGFIRAY